MARKGKKRIGSIGEGGVQDSSGMAELYSQSIKAFKPGQIVKAKIIRKSDKEVLVDIGYKSEGLIPIREFLNPQEMNVGDEIEVLLESMEDDEGRVVLSKQKADRLQGWERISTKFKEGDIIDGRVIRKVKGGLMVDVGRLEAFLPASLAAIDKNYAAINQLVGKTATFKIVKINRPRRNIVVSRKDLLMEEKNKKREKVLENVSKGALVTGLVKNITDFGVFIDVGEGLTGLLHITDMSWGRISHPSEMVAIGNNIEVMILDFDEWGSRPGIPLLCFAGVATTAFLVLVELPLIVHEVEMCAEELRARLRRLALRCGIRLLGKARLRRVCKAKGDAGSGAQSAGRQSP